MGRPAQRNKLSRVRDQRRALLKGLAESLIEHESIVTTKPKARALRPYVEKLITSAKVDNQHRRRLVRSRLSTDKALRKLFIELGPRYIDRPGGYTRIETAGWRRGDDAEMARISLVSNLSSDNDSKVETVVSQDESDNKQSKSKSEDSSKKTEVKTESKPKTKPKTTKTEKEKA